MVRGFYSTLAPAHNGCDIAEFGLLKIAQVKDSPLFWRQSENLSVQRCLNGVAAEGGLFRYRFV